MTPEMKPAERKYAHVLRPLTQDERASLRASLQRDGLLQSIVRDQHGDLLDGHHREELCAELGIPLHHKTVTTDDPVDWIKANQKARRNLSREEMRQLIAEQIMDTPHLSNKAVAKVVGANDHTVAKVRDKLITNGKIGNVVRFDTAGRVSKDKPRHSQLASVDQPQPSTALVPVKTVAPIVCDNRGYQNLTENILHFFADDNEYHAVGAIRDRLAAEYGVSIEPEKIINRLNLMTKLETVRVETRPAAKGTKRYRLYRQDGKLIGLAVLKEKFRPVIEHLKIEGQRPISHQSTARFNHAAGMLIQLLRDLEAE